MERSGFGWPVCRGALSAGDPFVAESSGAKDLLMEYAPCKDEGCASATWLSQGTLLEVKVHWIIQRHHLTQLMHQPLELVRANTRLLLVHSHGHGVWLILTSETS